MMATLPSYLSCAKARQSMFWPDPTTSAETDSFWLVIVETFKPYVTYTTSLLVYYELVPTM